MKYYLCWIVGMMFTMGITGVDYQEGPDWKMVITWPYFLGEHFINLVGK